MPTYQRVTSFWDNVWNFDWSQWRFVSPWENRANSQPYHNHCKKCWAPAAAGWFNFCVSCMNDILEAFYELWKERNWQ